MLSGTVKAVFVLLLEMRRQMQQFRELPCETNVYKLLADRQLLSPRSCMLLCLCNLLNMTKVSPNPFFFTPAKDFPRTLLKCQLKNCQTFVLNSGQGFSPNYPKLWLNICMNHFKLQPRISLKLP